MHRALEEERLRRHRDLGGVLNCWEFMQCGREEGGAHASELGVCPAFTQGAGEACWLIAGTFCGGTVQGSHARKLKTCSECEFHRRFDYRHHMRMLARFG